MEVVVNYFFKSDHEKVFPKLVLRVSSGESKYLETIKAHGRFICFSVFGYPDETLALVLEIVRDSYDAMMGMFGKKNQDFFIISSLGHQIVLDQ